MLGIDADIGAVRPSLEQAPEVLDAVGVDTTVELPLGAIYGVVRVVVAEPVVGRVAVGVDGAAALDGLPDAGLNVELPLWSAEALPQTGAGFAARLWRRWVTVGL